MRHAVRFEPTDRPPVIPQVFAYAGIQSGISVGQYVRNGETLADCQLAEWRKLGHAAVFALMDLSLETEAMGARLDYHDDRYPTIRSYPVTNVATIADVRPPDPTVHRRTPKLLHAAEILRDRTAEQAVVVGGIAGPMTVAVQLMGAETALNCAIDAPEEFERLLDVATETAVRLGSALLDHGVHVPLIFDPSATPEFIPPQFFREYELPRLKTLCSALKRRGAEAV